MKLEFMCIGVPKLLQQVSPLQTDLVELCLAAGLKHLYHAIENRISEIQTTVKYFLKKLLSECKNDPPTANSRRSRHCCPNAKTTRQQPTPEGVDIGG